MINGFGKWFCRAVWESDLGEQLERVAVKVKNKVEKNSVCQKTWGSTEGE